MPILLDDPFTYVAGHGQAPATYTHVKIAAIHSEVEESELIVHMRYGTLDPNTGAWIAGAAPPLTHRVWNEPDRLGPRSVEHPEGEPIPGHTKYDDMVENARTQLPAGSRVYDEFGLAIYQHLIAAGIYAGTIE